MGSSFYSVISVYSHLWLDRKQRILCGYERWGKTIQFTIECARDDL